MEQNTSNESLGAQKAARLTAPHDLHVHSIRKRLADSDGISAKAVIDGLIKAGVLIDDSPKYIKEISFSQEKGKKEKTILTFTEVVSRET